MQPLSGIGSYWEATASDSPPFPPLDRDLTTDVAIIGAGYTGLSTAHHLAERGRECVVLEAAEPGFGGSGRNGGAISPRFKDGFPALARAYGSETARAMRRLAQEAVDIVESLVERYSIECDFRRCGQITAAYGDRALQGLRGEADWLTAEAGDESVRLLERGEIVAELGTTAYSGGLLEPRGGAIHPLRYVRGLAGGLAARGVPIYARSPVQRLIEEPDRVLIETAGGTVSAGMAVLATNAYTPQWHAGAGMLHRRFVAVSSSLMTTAPLTGDAAGRVNPGGRPFADTKHLLHYGCGLPDGRLLFGGRGAITGSESNAAVFRRLEQAMHAIFPETRGVAITHRWSGLVAVTLDRLPHLGWLTRRIACAAGYGGRGVALAHGLGKRLADLLEGKPVDPGPLGLQGLRPLPMHALRRPLMQAAAIYYGLKDRLAR